MPALVSRRPFDTFEERVDSAPEPQVARSFDPGFSALGKTAQDMDRIMDDATNPVGRGEITLPLNVFGDDFKIVES